MKSSLIASLKASTLLKPNAADLATVGFIASNMPATNLKLQIILKDLTFKWLGSSHNAGEEITFSSAHPNYKAIKAVICTTKASKCA